MGAIMINNKPSLLRMDSLKRYEAYDILTSMVMVGTQHGEMLVAAAKAGKKGTFTRTGLQASTWQQLRNDVMAEQWSLDEKERYEMFKKLRSMPQVLTALTSSCRLSRRPIQGLIHSWPNLAKTTRNNERRLTLTGKLTAKLTSTRITCNNAQGAHNAGVMQVWWH